MNGDETVIVLGAGASRGVSYGRDSEFPSPLDYDFYDLLQRLNPSEADSRAVKRVLDRVNRLPRDYWRSFERSFYTLQLKAYLSDKFGVDRPFETDDRIVTDFAFCVHALLRKAHGKTSKCDFHEAILSVLEPSDTVLSFNYDLVVERALKGIALRDSISFGQWIYGFGASRTRRLPLILKLHGSSNWRFESSDGNGLDRLHVRTKRWEDLDKAPGYTRIATRDTTAFPIFLPFWDKRIEEKPWVNLWSSALAQLSSAKNVLVWGYSLPPTDIKAYVLFDLGLSEREMNLCVVDPSPETRARWRNFFPKARYWEYELIDRLFVHPPDWLLLPVLRSQP